MDNVLSLGAELMEKKIGLLSPGIEVCRYLGRPSRQNIRGI